MATHGLKCEVTWSMFPSMFLNLNRQRGGWNYLRGMEFAIDVEEYMESWRDRVCPECQGRHILSEGSVNKGVLWQNTTDPTLSLSPLETLCRHIVDHYTLPVVCSLCPSGQFLYRPGSSGNLLYAKTPLPYLWHFTCQQTLLNTCIHTQHLLNPVHPSFLTSPQKSNLSVWNQGHIGDGWHNTYIEA